MVAADTECTGLIYKGDWRTVTLSFGTPKKPSIEIRRVAPARPFAFSFCDQHGQTMYVRREVDPMTRQVLPGSKGDTDAMRDVFENDKVTKVFHNARYDIGMLEHSNIRVRGPVVDTMILAHVATAGGELSYALKPLCKKYLDYPDDDQKDLLNSVNRGRRLAKQRRWAYATSDVGGRKPAMADFWLGDRDLCRTYAIGDVERTQMLMQLWMDSVANDSDQNALFKREHKLFWVLKDMEDTGVRVYPKSVHRLKGFYQRYIDGWGKIARRETGGRDLAPNSEDIKVEFYEHRNHQPQHTGCYNAKKGRNNYRLNGEDLLKLANGYTYQKEKQSIIVPPDQLAKAILEMKAADQTISSFLDNYMRYWVREEYGEHGIWVLHPNYKQTGTITGRLSCSDPNMMQVASETTGRRKADIQSRPRECFGPRPGCYWYLPDYSQIEVWLFAFLSGERKMQEALMSGRDFHGTIAENVFGKRADFKEHKDYYRKCAKLIMFAKLYGGGIAKMASLLKTDIDSAKVFVERYEAELPGVKLFMSRMMNRASREGMIKNPFGRRYYFEPDWAYKSVNYLIQGTAADVMKNALVYVHDILQRRYGGLPKILMTIHDEIVVEVPEALHSRQLMRDIIRAMQRDSTQLGIPIPLPVEIKMVKPNRRWNKLTKFDKPWHKELLAA